VLVLAEPDTQLYDLATRDLITAAPEDDQEDVADTISKYDLLALPVVDENGKLLGIVTIDDAMDVMEEEHDEDLRIAGASNIGRDSEKQNVGSLLLWLLRKELWFVIWAVIAILVTMAGYLPLLAPALIFMPFVLLIATDVVSFAVNDLLEYGSATDAPAAWQLLGRNLVASLITAVVAIGLAAIMFGGLGSDIAAPGSATEFASFTPYPFQLLLLTGFVPTIIACVVVIAASALVTIIARRRLDRDRPIGSTALTMVMMGLGLVVQIGLVLLFSFSGVFVAVLG
jgi:hypothetical protein